MANLNGLTVNDSGFLGLPSGTTAERPASPTDGYIRKNLSTNKLEYFSANQNSWFNADEKLEIFTNGLFARWYNT